MLLYSIYSITKVTSSKAANETVLTL